MKPEFDFDPNDLEEGLKEFLERANTAIEMYAETSAQKLESYAKAHRKWTDRSSDARKRLKGKSTKVAKGYRLCLAHGVTYGKWLELAHEKKYAIIEPTLIEVGANDIMPGFQNLLNEMRGV